MAGESAAEVARRLREKAQRQLEVAEQYEKGTEGERATAEALSALPPESWTFLHDVRWPGRRRANIDHVAIGPGGVYVIDSKNWSGRVEIRDGTELRQDGRRRESAVTGAAEAALAITPIIAGVTGHAVVPVLCFHREERLAGWARDVMVCSTANVVNMLGSRHTVLTPEQVRDASIALDASLSGAAPVPVRAERSRTPRAASTQERAVRPRAQRRRRSDAAAKLVVAVLVLGALFVAPVRDGVTGVLSDFITSTAGGGATTEADPRDSRTAKERRRLRQQQGGQQQGGQQSPGGGARSD